MNMKKLFLLVAVVAAMAAVTYQTTFAGTDTYDTLDDGQVAHDGLPNCITFSGTDGGSGAMTVTIPKSFKPRYAEWFEGGTTTEAMNHWIWVYGMGTGQTVQSVGSTGVYSLNSAADTDAAVTTAGSFIIDDDSITDDKDYYGWVCR